MGRTCWIAGLVIAAGLGANGAASAEALEPLTLEVLLMDHVGVPAETLAEAWDETRRIFDRSGIHLVRVTGRVPQSRYVALQIVAAHPNRKARDPGVLGMAAGTKQALGTVAWLFYNRIQEQGRLHNLKISQMLGHVIAHEMGHLLLPYGSHMQAGIMKGGWDSVQASLAASRSLRFSADETIRIRAALSRASGIVASR